MLLAVGSTRLPKVEAVRRALATVAAAAPGWGPAEVVSFDVGALAPAMPLTLEALLEGARMRAERALEQARAAGRRADLALGLEGGIDVRDDGAGRRGFLMSWAYATDGRRGAHGCGGAIEVPPSLLADVVDRGVELGDAIDAFASQSDVRSRQGAWGVLTRGLLDRTRSFELALLGALAPFYNPESYR
jgi:inosine/xanthosine triphosphatase